MAGLLRELSWHLHTTCSSGLGALRTRQHFIYQNHSYMRMQICLHLHAQRKTWDMEQHFLAVTTVMYCYCTRKKVWELKRQMSENTRDWERGPGRCGGSSVCFLSALQTRQECDNTKKNLNKCQQKDKSINVHGANGRGQCTRELHQH